MKKTLIFVSMLIVALFLVGCAQTNEQGMENNMQDSSTAGKGEAIFTITDAAADMGSVSEIMLTVDSVQVHSQSEGWITLANDVGTFNLLELKAQAAHELLAKTQLNEGTYNQLRLEISKVIVIDNEGEHEAKLRSNELKIQGEFEVKEGQTSSASFDFIADESLHVTGNGKYIMAPVVQLETRENVQASVKSNNRVTVTGGNINANLKVGMDENGNVGVGIAIPANAQVELDNKGLVIAAGAKSKGNANSNTNVEVDTGVDVTLE